MSSSFLLRTFFSVDRFFVLQCDHELFVSEMRNKLRVADFVSEIKRVENYPEVVVVVDVLFLQHVVACGDMLLPTGRLDY